MEVPFNPKNGLYTVSLQDTKKLPNRTHYALYPLQATALSDYTIPAVSQMIKFLYALAGYPVISTWLNAIKKKHFITWLGLCTETVRRHLLPSPDTGKGHLKLFHQGQKSSKQLKQESNSRKKRHNLQFELLV